MVFAHSTVHEWVYIFLYLTPAVYNFTHFFNVTKIFLCKPEKRTKDVLAQQSWMSERGEVGRGRVKLGGARCRKGDGVCCPTAAGDLTQ